MWFLYSFFRNLLVQCAGHLAGGSGGSSVSTSAALARRRCEIRMGKRPLLSGGTSFPYLWFISIVVDFTD
jgi:hypothetical protein